MISETQRKFLEFCKVENKKPIDVNNRVQMVRMIVLDLFEIYIIAHDQNNKHSRHVKREIAWQLMSIKKSIRKHIKLWHLIEDKEEFVELVKEKISMNEKHRKVQQKRRHEKRGDFSLSVEEWEDVKKYFDYECAYCGKDAKLTYDHFHPFSKGGDFMKGNIIPACHSCNSSKNNKDFNEWYHKQPFYNKKRERDILKYINMNKQLALF